MVPAFGAPAHGDCEGRTDSPGGVRYLGFRGRVEVRRSIRMVPGASGGTAFDTYGSVVQGTTFW